MIEDTSKIEARWMLADASAAAMSAAIVAQEKRGQEQLVASEQLPARVGRGGREQYEKLGFVLGTPGHDALFMPAQLPAGWEKRPTDHDMWTKIYDDRGRARVEVFYKATYYDRDAFMRLVSAASYVDDAVRARTEVIQDGWITDAVLALIVAELRAKKKDRLVEFARYRAVEDGDYWAGQIAELHADLAEIDARWPEAS